MWFKNFSNRSSRGVQTKFDDEISEKSLGEKLHSGAVDLDSALDFDDETDEISTEVQAQSFVMTLKEGIARLFPYIKSAVIFFLSCVAFVIFVALISGIGNTIEIRAPILCLSNGTICNYSFQYDPLPQDRFQPYKVSWSIESPQVATEQPTIAMATTCKHQDCRKTESGYIMPPTASCVRRVCSSASDTTELQPIEACNTLHDSCSTKLTASYGFDCICVDPFRYLHKNIVSVSAEPFVDVCGSCAALLTLSFGYDCDENFLERGTNTTGLELEDATDDLCDSRGTNFFRPFEIECDKMVYSGAVEALVSKPGDKVSIKVTTSIAIERKKSVKEAPVEKLDAPGVGSNIIMKPEL